MPLRTGLLSLKFGKNRNVSGGIVAPMRRLNSEGIDRMNLRHALNDGKLVRAARQRGMCMLCRGRPVTSAGLCEGCLASLTDEEIRLATPWIDGIRT